MLDSADVEPLRISLATSEIFPFSKAGGLADVATALARHLWREGIELRVFSPLYAAEENRPSNLKPVDSVRKVPLQFMGQNYQFSLYTAPLPGSDLWVYFVHCPPLYGRASIYTDQADEPIRFLLLCRAVFESCQRIGFAPQIMHCNDWQTAPIPLLLRSVYSQDRLFANSSSLLTIHNAGYQGIFSASLAGALLPAEYQHLLKDALAGDRVNFLKIGILFADKLTTVSPTYACEIQTPEFGFGLDQLFARRRKDLYGILNGVDNTDWSPRTDALIPFRYGSDNAIRGKERNKRFLFERVGLPYRRKRPLVGIVSRLVEQKGLDLLFQPLPKLLSARDFQLVVVGSGEKYLEDFFHQLESDFPNQVRFHCGYCDTMAHLVEAACDIFLMPSRYEPCGLNQMYSLLYGALPVVRKTGGLADSVVPLNPGNGRGNGFVFEHATAEGVRWALELALDTYADRSTWLRMMQNAMSQDFSWEKQIKKYIDLYQQLVRK